MSSPSIPSTTIYGHHKAMTDRNLTTGCPMAVASFLIIGALIVIMGACLCLTLPGVNVITQIVGPAIFPSLIAIALSFLFIIKARRSQELQKQSLEARNEAAIDFCEENNVLDMSEDQLFRFIKNELLSEEWHESSMKMDRHKMLEVIKKHYAPEKEDPDPRKKEFKKTFVAVQKRINRKVADHLTEIGL